MQLGQPTVSSVPWTAADIALAAAIAAAVANGIVVIVLGWQRAPRFPGRRHAAQTTRCAFRPPACSVKLARPVPAPLSRSAARWRLLAILALVLVLFAPSLRNTFALDDRLIAKAVREGLGPNVMVQEVQPLARYFTTNYWQGIDPKDVLYRPVTVLSYAVLYAAIGRHLDGEAGEALPQHAANVLLHLLAVWLVYCLARRVHLPRAASLLAALVFGAHAIHSEVVAGVVGRSELLAFVFGAAAVLVATARATPARLAGAGALVFLAFGSKESAVAWTGVLALFVVARELGAPATVPFRRVVGKVLRRTAVVAGPALALFLLLRANMIASLPPTDAAATADAWAVRLTGTTGWAWGLAMSLLPVHLACDHGPAVFTPITSPLNPRFLLAALAILGLGILAAATWRRAPRIALGAAVFLAASVLIGNVLFPIGVPFAERLYYTPSFGVCLMYGALAQRLPARFTKPATVAFVLWLGWSAFMIVRRNPVWANDAALFAYDYHNQPRSARIALNWAGVLRDAGRDQELVPVLQRVVELDPHMAAAWNELGVRAMQSGDPEQAIAHFTACLRAQRQDSDIHKIALENLVRVHLARKQAPAAVAAIEQVARVEPATVARAFLTLQDVLGDAVTAAWAVELSRRLQAAAPGASPDWDRQRGLACVRRQAHPEAIAFFRAWLPHALTPLDRQQTTLLLGSSLVQVGDLAAARAAVVALLGLPSLAPEIQKAAQDLMQKIETRGSGGR